MRERRSIPRVMISVASGPRQEARLFDLAEEVVQLAREVIVDARNIPDDCLGRVAAFMDVLPAGRSVKVCGLTKNQMRRLFDLGIDPDLILVPDVRR